MEHVKIYVIWLITLVYLAALFTLYAMLANRFDNSDWLLPIIIGLGTVFGFDIHNHLRGKRTTWSTLNTKEKIFYTLTILFLLFAIDLPIYFKAERWIILLATLLGFTINWLLVYFWGSESMKEKILWPKFKKDDKK